jgi:hypothetical protein
MHDAKLAVLISYSRFGRSWKGLLEQSLVAEGKCLPIRCLAAVDGYTYRHINYLFIQPERTETGTSNNSSPLSCIFYTGEHVCRAVA